MDPTTSPLPAATYPAECIPLLCPDLNTNCQPVPYSWVDKRGRAHVVWKRYSRFDELRKKLGKGCVTQ